MPPFPSTSGEAGFGGNAGNGDSAGGRRPLTTGEIVAIVVSCVLGPGIISVLLVCACLPTLVMLLHGRARRKHKKLEREATLVTGIVLGERAPLPPA